MKYIFSLLLILSISFAYSQVRPDQFTVDSTPGDSISVYTLEGEDTYSEVRKIYWIDLKKELPSGITVTDDTMYLEGVFVADLKPYLDNTDSQTLSIASDLLSITGGNSVDLSGYLDNTDDQTVDNFSITTNTLSLELENDGEAPYTVDLSPYLDNTDDSTRLIQDTILVYYQGGIEVDRDTIRPEGGGGGLSPWTDGGTNIYPTTITDKVSIGVTTSAKMLTVQDGSEQLQLRNSASNRSTFSTEANGYLKISTTGNRFMFGEGTPSTYFQVRKDQNTSTLLSVLNNTTGTASLSGFEFTTDSAIKLQAKIHSTSFSNSGINKGGGAVITANGTNGLTIMATNAAGELYLGATGASEADIQATIDGEGVQIENLIKMVPTATVPSGPSSGWIYMDDGTNTGGTPTLRYYNGTSWVNM